MFRKIFKKKKPACWVQVSRLNWLARAETRSYTLGQVRVFVFVCVCVGTKENAIKVQILAFQMTLHI